MDSVFNVTASPFNNSTFYAVTNQTELCRDRHGEFPPAFYNVLTCALCYTYIFADNNVSIDYRTLELVTGTNTNHPEGTRMFVDLDNVTSVSMVCGTLSDPKDCGPWLACCREARRCCEDQISKGPKPYKDYGRTICPRTWDGFACWSDTPAGQRPRTLCPAHVPEADTGSKSNPRCTECNPTTISSKAYCSWSWWLDKLNYNDHTWHAYKTCTSNGTWYVNPVSNKEWTDYTECNNMKHYQRLHKAVLACNMITVILLVPACIIFLYYRPLRQQHRIRLHICLMISSLMTSVSMLLWEFIIVKASLETEDRADNTSNKNSVGCRVLYVLTRYAEVASFMWMFIEGFHLHRLLIYAFTVPKTLITYYIFGFGFPILPLTVYSAIRSTNSDFNKKCWIQSIGAYEWIIYVPSLSALVINVFFLLRIVFIMIRQLEPHPNEPNNFRRAVKAVVVLVPLFGLQFLLFVYRPKPEESFYEASEMLSKICSSLQGAAIAITFCYLSKEVQGHLKLSCLRLLRRSGRKDMGSRSYTATTQCMSELSRTRSCNGNADMIALRPIYNSQSGDDCFTKESSVDLINGNLHTIPENMDEDVTKSRHTDSKELLNYR